MSDNPWQMRLVRWYLRRRLERMRPRNEPHVHPWDWNHEDEYWALQAVLLTERK